MSTLITLVCIAGLLAAAAPHIIEQCSQAAREALARRRLRKADNYLAAAAEAAINGQSERAANLLESGVALLKMAALYSDELDSASAIDQIRRVSAEVTNCLRTHAELTIVKLGRLARETEGLCAQFESQGSGSNPASNRYRGAQGEAA